MIRELHPLIEAMTHGEFYPHRPSTVELRQTHISYVFLAGPFVYKVKKPVRFPFLDYSTLERRRHFCEEEIRLNRRLAPETYLGVDQILKTKESFSLAECSPAGDDIVEYAVKMVRLPEDQMLSFRLRQGTVEPGHMRALARKLASFHRQVSTERAAQFGSLEANEPGSASSTQLRNSWGKNLAPRRIPTRTKSLPAKSALMIAANSLLQNPARYKEAPVEILQRRRKPSYETRRSIRTSQAECSRP